MLETGWLTKRVNWSTEIDNPLDSQPFGQMIDSLNWSNHSAFNAPPTI